MAIELPHEDINVIQKLKIEQLHVYRGVLHRIDLNTNCYDNRPQIIKEYKI